MNLLQDPQFRLCNVPKDRFQEALAVRRAWREGRSAGRLPAAYALWGAPGTCSLGAMVRDAETAVRSRIAVYNHQFAHCPDSDWLPVYDLAYLGEGMIPSMFGAVQYVVEHNPPYTEGRVMQDLARDLPALPRRIDPNTDGWGPILHEHLRLAIEATEGQVFIPVCDHQSPYGIASKLISNEALILAMFDTPELVHELMAICTQATIDTIEAMRAWVGNDATFVLNHVDPNPDGGLILWDDFISVLSPELHREFCLPYNQQLYNRYGRGHLHTCGPNFPRYLDAILAHDVRSIDIIIMRDMSKTRADVLLLHERACAAGVSLHGSLTTCDTNLTSPKSPKVAADDDLVVAMAQDNRLFWTEGGNAESVPDWQARLKRINQRLFG